MRRYGKDRYGRQRWQCCRCGQIVVHKRPDHQRRASAQLLAQWLTSSQSLSHFAHIRNVSLSTIQRHLAVSWRSCPLPTPYIRPARVIVLDALSVVKHQCMAFIARDAVRGPVMNWQFAPRESHATWKQFLIRLPKPRYVVCDGQRGLLKAISEQFPDALIQRCMIHVIRQANLWLTRNPRMRAGVQLQALVRVLPKVQTRRQKRKWIRLFKYWCRKHHDFLKERTYSPANPKRWWYTHRKLRAVRSLLKHSSPDLFRFIKDRAVPRTSNHVEGGINSRMKDLFRRHRGIKGWKKVILAGHYLRLRQD